MLAIILSFLVCSAMEKSDKNEVAIIAMSNFGSTNVCIAAKFTLLVLF